MLKDSIAVNIWKLFMILNEIVYFNHLIQTSYDFQHDLQCQ